MAEKVKMNARESEFFSDTRRYNLRLDAQVWCCNDRYRPDFVGRARSGKRVPIELNDSHRGSRLRARDIRDEFGSSIIEIEYSDYRRDKIGTILTLKERLERM